jgi:small conductance mechanosensitive channel
MEHLLNDVLDYIKGYYDELVRLLPRMAIAVVIFSCLYLIANWFRTLTSRRLSRRMRDPLLAQFLARLVKTIIVIMAIAFVMRIIGLGGVAAGLMAGAGIGAFIIGFAFKDIGENFLAGVLLAFKRPFRIGDVVEINGVKGRVVSLNLRDTQIKAGDGRDIFVPNANIMKNPIMNFTLDGFTRHEFIIRVDGRTDILKTRELIVRTMCMEPTILSGERDPKAEVNELGPAHVDLKVTYWLDHTDKAIDAGAIRSFAIQHVKQALAEEGVAPWAQ